MSMKSRRLRFGDVCVVASRHPTVPSVQISPTWTGLCGVAS